MSLAQELTARGFIHQFSSDNLAELLDGEAKVVYHGIDPSADSAHAGNFVNWMLLKHLKKAGHEVIFLVGGGTGMVGDPKVDVERELTEVAEISRRVEKLKQQAERLFEGEAVRFVNNADWLASLNLIDFLREVGKHFTVNDLIKKDAIAQRLAGEHGISYTEFAYPLLQAYDYLTLHRTHGCNLQVGGSDQWGNMVAGIDLIRRLEKKRVDVVTVPLIIDKTTGKKFGKSEGNAIWLDAEKTSPFAFYQFWHNTVDENVIDYLKLFTLLPLTEIEQLREGMVTNPGSRTAQKQLAYLVTAMVHGETEAEAVAKVSALLFGEVELHQLEAHERAVLLANAPITEVRVSDLVTILVDTSLASSKREARTFIESGAITLNGEKITDLEHQVEPGHFKDGLLLLKRGKRNVAVLVSSNN